MSARSLSRKALLAFVLLIVQALPSTVGAEEVSKQRVERLAPWSGYILEASSRFALPPRWIEKVILAESGGVSMRNGQPIRSRAGAIGLMQVMPKTYEDMRIVQALGRDPGDPHDNILAGSAYLRAMYDLYGYPGLFAAYNAGPTRYEASLNGVRLPLETKNYVAHITARLAPDLAPDLAPQTLFVPLSRDAETIAASPAAQIFVLRAVSGAPG